jgi:hypothetical protein
MKRQVFESCVGAIDDTEFFSEAILGENIDGLSIFTQEHNWESCAQRFADWMRGRPKPSFCPYREADGSQLDQAHLTKAKDILKGVFTLPDSKGGFITETLVGDFEWSPEYADGSTYYPPKMFRYFLNQHEPLSSLGEVYFHTSETGYRDRIVELLMDWVRRVPTYWELLPGNECKRQHWQNMMSRNRFEKWLDLYPLISAALSDQDAVDLMKAMVLHARLMDDYVTKNMGSGLTGTLVGMIKVNLKFAILFPQTQMARHAVETFRKHFRTGIDTMFYPDGGLKYSCAGYHKAVSGWYVQAVALAEELELSGMDYERNMVQQMQAYSVYLMKPDGSLPLLGDTGWGMQAGSMADWRRVMLDELKPETPSQALAWSGAYALRSGWEPEDLYLFLNAGPHGTMHNHQDHLSFEVSAYGKPVIVEPGITPYGRADQRAQLISSQAHNSLTVDGDGQHRAHTEPTSPSSNPWHTSLEFDFVEGIFDAGFGPGKSINVMHIRSVLFIKSEYFLIIDRLMGDGRHDLRWHFMFHPLSLALNSNGNGVRSHDMEGANVAFSWSDPDLSSEVFTGETEYPYRGLMTGDNDRPTCSLFLDRRSCIPSTTAFLIEPLKEEGQPTMTVSQLDVGEGAAVRVEHPDGEDLVLVSPTVAGEFQTDGVVTVFRSKSDKLRSVLTYGGTSVTVGGVPVADLNIPVNWH